VARHAAGRPQARATRATDHVLHVIRMRLERDAREARELSRQRGIGSPLSSAISPRTCR
jgi:hypothetical protein